MLSGDVEVDDFYLHGRGGGVRGRAGRGTSRQPLVLAVERGRGRPGACVVRAVSDCSAGSYSLFAAEHLDPACHVLADGWSGAAAGLGHMPGLDQRRFDPGDPDASLPTAHHAISNFKAFAEGTFHGLPGPYVQAFADAFSWRYSHRGSPDACADLLADACVRRRTAEELRSSTFLPQPAVPRGRRLQL